MTDLREKIEGILYDYGLEYGGPICMVTKATDAIMALVQPVCGDLHQTLKSALMDYADALWNEGDPDPDAAAEALARRVQPVVTDELFDQMILDCEQLYGALMAEKKWTEAEELERRIDWLRSRKGGAS